jgi:hypothetical protein
MPPFKATVVAVTAKLCAHAHDAGVQAACCDTLSRLTEDDDDDDVDDATAADALNAVVGALRQHLHHAELQQRGCRALVWLVQRRAAAHDDSLAATCAGDAAAPAVVAALRAHSGDAEVQAWCCCALRCITHHRPRNLLKAGAAGANEAVLAAMRGNLADARVQYEGCFALGVMCQDNNAANQAKAGAAGGVEAVLAALRAFPAISGVAEIALFALKALVHENAANQRTAGASGAVEAVLGCMRGAHMAVANVQDNTCMALVGLIMCGDDPNVNLRAAHASGALDAVAAVMRAVYAADEDASSSPSVSKKAVQDSACLALRFLIDRDEQHKREAVRAGVLEALQRQEAHRGGLEDARLELIAALQPVAARHDDAAASSGGCAHYPSCQRCAHLRATYKLCALPGCGARKRRDGSGKTLLRCGRCGISCYCGAAHQREDWARHKLECARPKDDDTA